MDLEREISNKLDELMVKTEKIKVNFKGCGTTEVCAKLEVINEIRNVLLKYYEHQIKIRKDD